jgi:hypothetical protein
MKARGRGTIDTQILFAISPSAEARRKGTDRNEYEYCEGIHQNVSISKSLLKEEHCDFLCFA